MRHQEAPQQKAQRQKTQPPTAVDQLNQELARIEDSVVNNECSAQGALDRIAAAVGKLDSVSMVVLATDHGAEFLVRAGFGPTIPARNKPVEQGLKLYRSCLATNRLLRCEDLIRDDRFGNMQLSDVLSFMLLPVAENGVLAVFSKLEHGLNVEHILPLSTAATLCALLLPMAEKNEGAGVAQAQNSSDPEELSPIFSGNEIVSPRVQKADEKSELASPFLSESEDQSGGAHESAVSNEAISELANELLRGKIKVKEDAGLTPVPSRPKTLLRLGVFATSLLCAVGAISATVYVVRKEPTVQADLRRPSRNASFCEVAQSTGEPAVAKGQDSATRDAIAGGRVILNKLPEPPTAGVGKCAEGTVDAVLSVDVKGIVEDVRIANGQTPLNDVTASALSHWRFAPFLSEGHPVAVSVPVSIAFRHK